MPRRQRSGFTRRAALDSRTQAWLAGDRVKCGFIKFKHPDELATIWTEYGDHENMYWDRNMRIPEPRCHQRPAPLSAGEHTG